MAACCRMKLDLSHSDKSWCRQTSGNKWLPHFSAPVEFGDDKPQGRSWLLVHDVAVGFSHDDVWWRRKKKRTRPIPSGTGKTARVFSVQPAQETPKLEDCGHWSPQIKNLAASSGRSANLLSTTGSIFEVSVGPDVFPLELHKANASRILGGT